MDPEAVNFNPEATKDDGKCSYKTVFGCTDPMATNFQQSFKTNGRFKEFEVINFKKTSDHNSILMQVFETDPNRSKIKKLDIIDAGEFIDDEDVNQRFEKRVFYVGKIFFDSFNSPTFINIFTIVMD